MCQLIGRQYRLFGGRRPSMDADVSDGCVVMAYLMQHVGHCRVRVMGAPGDPLLAYSGASMGYDYGLVDEERREQPRMGWVCSNHHLVVAPQSRTMELPHVALELVRPHQQQFYTGRALAVPETVVEDPGAFIHKDGAWFADDEAVCSSLIRGALLVVLYQVLEPVQWLLVLC